MNNQIFQTAAIKACKEGDINVIQQLYDNGFDFNQELVDNGPRVQGDLIGPRRPLSIAIWSGQKEVVKKLIQFKVKLDYKIRWSDSKIIGPQQFALEAGKLDIFIILHNAGINADNVKVQKWIVFLVAMTLITILAFYI